ncbi:hypothetical protein PV326_001497, partial [Microctonus aethiopoides]
MPYKVMRCRHPVEPERFDRCVENASVSTVPDRSITLCAIPVLEAEGMLREPVNRQHWVHQFFSQRDSLEKFQ